MDRVFCMIGQIMEVTQYIEFNMALMLRFDVVLSNVRSHSKTPLKQYRQIELEAVTLQEELSRATMGEIVWKIKDINVLKQDELQQLEQSLRMRNLLAHRFFKENDFVQNENDPKYLPKREKQLKNIFEDMMKVNMTLVDVIKQQETIYRKHALLKV